jgi:hypothetical protein
MCVEELEKETGGGRKGGRGGEAYIGEREGREREDGLLTEKEKKEKFDEETIGRGG